MEWWEFIDSPDVRAECREHRFTPAEQAVLCWKSNLHSYDEKVAFLKSLLACYPGQPFPFFDDGDEINMREWIEDCIQDWEHHHPETGEHHPDDVFVLWVSYLGNDPDRALWGGLYHTFRKAHEHLLRYKARLDRADAARMMATIDKERIDDPSVPEITYTLNDACDVIKVSTFIDCFAFDIPVPFCKGDILFAAAERYQQVRFEKSFYCVTADCRKIGDQHVMVFAWYDAEHNLRWTTNPIFRLRLQSCKEEGLDDEILALRDDIVKDVVSCPVKYFRRYYADAGVMIAD